MNYYEKHIGDYIRDTVSLTMLEDGAYNRLMDQCYQSEKPLPLDKKMIYRLARAASAPERKAVDFVVDTFFQKTEEGYVQKRVQEEIERYWERDTSKEQTRENDKERQRRARERRKQLFAELRRHGITPEFNTPSKELSRMLSRVTNTDQSQESHEDVTCDNTANQTPDTRHQEEIHTDADAPKKYSMRKDLLDRGIPEQLVKDWLECRKAKKLANTLTAMEGVLSEVEKAGIGLEAALKTCCERGWGGFKAKWLQNDPQALNLEPWEQ